MGYLIYMMEWLEFNSKWVKWKKVFLESSTIYVALNRSPILKFTPTLGLEQGDSLASFLFFIVVESLVRLVRQGAQKWW